MKIGRNESCPCGSKLKYKKCCLNREDDPRSYTEEGRLELVDEIMSSKNIKQCIHPDHSKCSQKIIKAHSIQNNKILRNISEEGMLYMPLQKRKGNASKRNLYGRKEATVFTGFCGHHDKTVFQAVEDNHFDKSQQHIFLHAYRCFAASGFECMETDLYKNEMQSLVNLKEKLKHTFFSVFPENGKSYVIISWLKTNADFFRNYKKQLDNLDLNQRKNYINNLVPMVSENIVINPKKWDNLREDQRKAFIELFYGADMFFRMEGHILDRLDDPGYDLFDL